jgi:DNA-binding response OmpR family regulator
MVLEELHVQQCRVLVVDDNRDAADLLADLLLTRGFAVRTAYNGRDAIRLLDEYLPSIGILDIGLPDVLGYDIAAEARKRLDDLVFLIAVTGWGNPNDVQRAKQAGFDFHITKPADFDDLVALIEKRCWDVKEKNRSGRVQKP